MTKLDRNLRQQLAVWGDNADTGPTDKGAGNLSHEIAGMNGVMRGLLWYQVADLSMLGGRKHLFPPGLFHDPVALAWV